MGGTLKNYYEILGVPRSATPDQIRTAYRKLLLKFHPDKNIGDSYFEEWSKKINEAFEVLMTPEVRADYDVVYDETRLASQQATTANKDARDDSIVPDEDPPVSVDAAIQKLAPVYISAKQAYIKATRNVTAIEAGLKSKQMNASWHFILGGILAFALLVWIAVANKDFFKSASSAVPVVEQAAIVPLPLPKKQELEPLPAQQATRELALDLWIKVVAPKTYFFEQPGASVLNDKFLSKGNKAQCHKKAGNYYYAIFQSAVNSSYRIEGWIKTADVEIVAQ
ncbi:J domain-containing protein [Niabella hibiscisoli]|uniref:J domain-containing protein n=1 Tax=Niabella hibiscisoli TaxID=1825928 RepID=UPI001F0DBB64|nr:J domain-containing protein [Niabella hibiscisoli]MCH5721013.1 J domain-containing protein [Niabella hibiscisoli]